MLIINQNNPLNTQVTLDAGDRAKLQDKITIDILQTRLIEVAFYLKKQSMLQAMNIVDTDTDIFSSPEVTSQLDSCVEALLSSHCGDCTKISCSCMKCYAEELLGINTLPPIHGSIRNCIFGAFSHDNIHTCADAINYLKLNPVQPRKGYTEYHEQWQDTQNKAIDFLIFWESQGMRAKIS